MTEGSSRGVSLHTRILLGLVLGAVCGTAVNLYGYQTGAPPWFLSPLLTYVMDPLGQVFLRLLLMTVVPLVFASLAIGVAQFGDLRRLGRIGAKTFAFFVITMTVATCIGLLLVNTVQPGVGLPEETRQHLLATYAQGKEGDGAPRPASFGIQTFVAIIPRNPLQSAVQMDMLGVIFFALLVGVGLTTLPKERARVLYLLLEAIGDVMVFIIGLAMKFAPYGVFALIFAVTARFGLDLLRQLGMYVGIVLLGLAIQMFGVLSILVRVLAGLNPLVFFQKVRDVIVTAFSTSSSNATLPTSLKITQEELGVPGPVAGFVLPLGATMNMNGTALYEGVTVVFLAQVFGVSLTMTDQIIVVILSVLTAIGAAGVPGGSLPLLAMVLTSVGVPAEALGLILGVDRLLDMCRTTLNVVGDIAAAVFVARSEGYELLKPPTESSTAAIPEPMEEQV